MEYIRVNSIKDIDLSTITLKDLGRRYQDSNGWRYALKFNRSTRRIEVVRIVQGRDEAEKLRRQARENAGRFEPGISNDPIFNFDENKAAELSQEEEAPATSPVFTAEPSEFENMDSSSEPGSVELNGGGADEIFDFDESYKDESFYEKTFIDEAYQELSKIKERLSGIGNMVRQSKIFEGDSFEKVATLIHDLDSKCIQRCDDTINQYKELVSFPRQFSYYVSRLNQEQVKKIDTYSSDELKMEYIRRIELQHYYKECFQLVLTKSNRMLELLRSVSGVDLDSVAVNNQQFYNDAISALEFLIENCNDKLKKIKIWRDKYN